MPVPGASHGGGWPSGLRVSHAEAVMSRGDIVREYVGVMLYVHV